MNTLQYAQKLGLKISAEGKSREITGCYIGDLLSWVMGKAQSGQVWITVMSNMNVAAVASMADSACVVLCEGAVPDAGLIERANKLELGVFTSELTAYELALLTASALE